MNLVTRAVYQRVINGAFAFILAIGSITALTPFIFSRSVSALDAVSVCSAGCSQSDLQAAVNQVNAGGTITLASDLSIATTVNINKPLTIEGAGFTLRPNFAFSSNSVNTTLAILGTSNVTINNLTIDGVAGTGLHGINAYVSSSVSLNNVSLLNNDRSGLVVNGSTVTVNNINTAGNGWHGINVDQGGGVTSPAVLTVNGISTHAELAPDIYIDNVTENVGVIDANAQYNVNNNVRKANVRVMSIKAAAPTIISPSAEQYFNTTPIVNSWTPVSYTKGISEYQVEYIYDDGHAFAGGPYRNVPGTVTSRNHQPSATEQGGVTVRVRAIDALGNYGNWSTPVHYTYDSVAPTKPVLAQPSNGALLNTNNFLFNWNDSTDASPLTYEFQSSQDPSRDGNGVLNGSGIWRSGVLPTSQIQSSGAPDGSWFYQVRAKDAAGNYSQWSDIWSVKLDTTSPAISFIGTTPAENAYIRNTVGIQVVVTDSNPGPYNLRIENGAPAPLSLGLSYVFLPVSGATNTYNWNTKTGDKAVADGVHKLVATSVDKAGNRTSVTRNVTVDNTRPVVQISEPSVDSLNPTEIVIDGTDNIGLNRVTANIYNETNTTLIKSCSANAQPVATTSYQLTCAISGLADGTYTIRTNASDLAGNIAQTLTRTFTIDTLAPSATINQSTEPVVAGASVTFTGTVTGDYSQLRLIFNGVAYDVVDIIGDVWSFTFDTTGLVEDNYDVEINAADAAGNGSMSDPLTTMTTLAVVAPAPAPAPDDEEGSEEVLGTDTNEPNTTPLAGRAPQTTNFGSVLGTATPEDDSQAAESAPQGEPDVAGAAIDVVAQADTDATDGTFLGLAWYWWVLIVGGLAALIGWIIAATRRRAGDA